MDRTARIKKLKLRLIHRYTDPQLSRLKIVAYVQDAALTNYGSRVKCALYLNGFQLHVFPIPKTDSTSGNQNQDAYFNNIENTSVWCLNIKSSNISVKEKSFKVLLKPRTSPNVTQLEFENERDMYIWAIACKKNAYFEIATENLELFYSIAKYPVKMKSDIKLGVDKVSGSKLKIAFDNLTGEQVVIRVLKFKRIGHEFAQQQERLLNSDWDHPNIVKTYDLFHVEDKIYVVQEFIEGGKLFTSIERLKSISEQDVSQIIRQVVAGLAYLHERDVIHGCINPSNILCKDLDDPTRRIKLVEFFNSIDLLDHIPDPDIIRRRLLRGFVGAAFYMPPELLDDSQEFVPTPALDIWCVGVTAFWLLTGKPPFEADDLDEYKQVVKGGINFQSEQWLDYSYEALNFIKDTLHEEPAKRPQAVNLLDHPWLVENDAISRSFLPYDCGQLQLQRRNSKWSKMITKIKVFKSLGSSDISNASTNPDEFEWRAYEPESYITVEDSSY